MMTRLYVYIGNCRFFPFLILVLKMEIFCTHVITWIFSPYNVRNQKITLPRHYVGIISLKTFRIMSNYLEFQYSCRIST